ncbi:DoxX family protein [Streptomyces sp. cg28]|uniref:DoxX family protein n=1 Tax=Streptomyces sp. cg28 TaxID=3403457 RepID=UPI003B21382D
MSLPSSVRQIVLLLARLATGAVFFAHGWQKLFTNGIDGTAAFFGQSGVPAAHASAWYAALVELGAGAALILGFAVPVAGVLLLLDMAGAFTFVHAGAGLFVDQGGYELVLLLGVSVVLLIASGTGRYSIDHVLTRRKAVAPAGR